MDRLKHIKETLTAQVQSQMANLHCVDTKELGEVIDMVKDLEEAIYYCTITEAMSKEGRGHSYYSEPMYYTPMYYSDGQRSGSEGSNGNNNSQGSRSSGNSRNYSEGNGGGRQYYGGGMMGYPMGYDREYPVEWRDHREGRSPKTRRMYMESKSMKHDKAVQMQELEQYMKELSQDVTEMISGSSPEEKQLLKTKLTTLVSKIDQA